jgi:glycosyltransferase involved in cell wall biosynthesis
MHILHLIDALDRGGAERMLVDIANATVQAGETVSVCVTRQGTALASELHPTVKLWELNRQKRFDWRAFRQLDTLVHSAGVDVLHVHGRSTFSLIMTIKTLGLLPTPVVLHDHYGAIEVDCSIPPWLRYWGNRFIDCYVGVHPQLGAWAATVGIAPERIFVIANALDLNRLESSQALDLRSAFRINADVPIGVIVCGIRHDKGIDLALQALAQLKQTPFAVLVVGGDREPDYAAACRSQCAALGLDPKVLFLGERPDVPAILRGADFAILPSRTESGPLVLLEYMYARLPFVAFRVGSISQRVAGLGGTEFVPSNDVPALAQAIAALLHLPPTMRQMRGEHGQTLVKGYFDIRQAIPRWHAIYQKAMKRTNE